MDSRCPDSESYELSAGALWESGAVQVYKPPRPGVLRNLLDLPLLVLKLKREAEATLLLQDVLYGEKVVRVSCELGRGRRGLAEAQSAALPAERCTEVWPRTCKTIRHSPGPCILARF